MSVTAENFKEKFEELRRYHGAQYLFWKQLQQNSIDKNNAYASSMMAKHLDFNDVLLDISNQQDMQ